jgi:Carboxypeptidase regulatory-like domain
MKLMTVLAPMFFTLGVAGNAFAQASGSALIGIVRDSAGLPKPGVQFIVGKLLVTNSDSAGRFKVAEVPPGRYPIWVRSLGFYDLTFRDVEFVAGDTVRLDFRLVPLPWRSDECLTVEGCRQSR